MSNIIGLEFKSKFPFNASEKYLEGASNTNGQLKFSLNLFEEDSNSTNLEFSFEDSSDKISINFLRNTKNNGKIRFLSSNGSTYESSISEKIFRPINLSPLSSISPSEVFSHQEKIKDLSIGKNHILFILQNFNLYGYGKNSYGELGDGTVTEKTDPIHISNNTYLCSAGNGTSIFVRKTFDEDILYALGDNSVGQLGIPTRNFSQMYFSKHFTGSPLRSSVSNFAPIKTPTKLASVKHSSDFGIVSISSGETHTAYVTGSGNLYVAGHNDKGQCNVPLEPVEKLREPASDVNGQISVNPKNSEKNKDDMFTGMLSTVCYI